MSGQFLAGGTGRQEAPFVDQDWVAPPPEGQRLDIVVFINNTSIRPSDRNRVICRLPELLGASLGPDDNIFVMTQRPVLEIRHAFSDPLEDLGDTLDTIELEIGGRPSRSRSRGTVSPQFGSDPSPILGKR
jgi:hypothetical protein